MTSTLNDFSEVEVFASLLSLKADLKGWMLDDYLEEVRGRLQTSEEGSSSLG